MRRRRRRRRRSRRRDTLISVASVLTLMAARVRLITPAAGICFGWVQFLSLFLFLTQFAVGEERECERERECAWDSGMGREAKREGGRGREKNQ